MERSLKLFAVAALIGTASSAFGASGAEYDGNSFLMVLFIGFGALIIAFQFLLVGMLLYGTIKGILSRPLKEAPAVGDKSDK